MEHRNEQTKIKNIHKYKEKYDFCVMCGGVGRGMR